ncbi:C40 family peptidase [Trichlorobacter lovleyi]|uniref:NLP/P60 protein n=1 Tax=Trichlorobacter lovleyi (strain ATCC BAA-1151 / DSM 17278 / SZ) TaxID=398767 RepID=B3E949_TRIL1|nr:C40 family peptidase [Trichlorobacter lovleyi]ACD96762.1 NLP/P60 protein [Trichlorobacter lovleyi SZ]
MTHCIRLISAICLLLLALPLSALASKTHQVRTKESLHSIARKYRVSVEELKAANNLSSIRIAKGTTLIIPSRASAQPVIENCSSYTVAKGDTLPKIAKKTGKKMSELRRINNLKANKVKPGQVLALADTAATCDLTAARQTRGKRLELVNSELLNEQELSATLSELSDIDADTPVDLAKNLEERSTTFSTLQKSAYGFLGARYRFGGNSRYALDCSSFTQQVFREQKVSLPRTAREQFRVGNEVPRGDLRRGDLVFFRTYAPFASHVGIYLGNRKMIHASSAEHRVVISSMDTPYYLSRYLGARRIDRVNPDTININDLMLGIEEEKEGDVLANDHLGLNLPDTLTK